MKRKRAQTSVEFLLILSIAVFVLAAVIIVSTGQMGTMSSIKEENDAKNTLRDLSAAAKDVYSQGEGARKQVYINLPSSYQANESFIGNHSLKLKARGSDYVAVEDFNVHGSFPGTKGAHWVWVISEGNKVRIGNAMLTSSKNSIYLIMDRDSTETVSFYVRNVWDGPLTVTPSSQWTPTRVTMDILPSGSYMFDSGQTQDMTLTFATDSYAAGYYVGKVILFADDGAGNNETLEIPVTIDVIGFGESLAPPLNVTPDFWGQALLPGDSVSKDFDVCTNTVTSVTDVTFTPSPGNPGSWVSNLASLGPLGQDECRTRTLTVTVPNTTAPGEYKGTIYLEGVGAEHAEDQITLYFYIDKSSSGFDLENQSMCNCPVGSTYWGVPLCNCVPATIYVMDGIVHGGPLNGTVYNGTLMGGPGNDIISGTNESDIIYSGVGNDMVCGQEGDDYIHGDNAEEMLDGGPGNDVIYGYAGDDKIYGKAGDDVIYGGQGWDEADGGSGNDVLYGGTQDDLLYGGPGNDELYGGDNKDILCGNADADTLYGDGSQDSLDGGTGTDWLDAGEGTDDCFNGEVSGGCESIIVGYHPKCGPS